MKFDVVTRLERQCLAQIAAVEVVRDSIRVAAISTTDIIKQLEDVAIDAPSLDFGLALRYSIKLFQKLDILVTHPKK